MNRAWIVCAALAIGIHALLLLTINPSTLAKPRPLADESSAVELSIVEAAPAAPAAAQPPQPEPPLPPPPEPPPPPPEPMPEPVREPTPEPAVTKQTPPPRPRSEVPKPRVAAPSRTAPALPAPSSGSVSGAKLGTAPGRAASTSARPRYRSNPKPDYPPESRRAHQQGVVLIAVQVTADGRAASVQLARSSGFPLLDSAALQAVRRWTFDPARMAGIATASRVEVPVRFDLARP